MTSLISLKKGSTSSIKVQKQESKKDSSLETDTSVLLVSPSLKTNLSKMFRSNNGSIKTVLTVHGSLVTSGSGAVLGSVSLDPSVSSEWSSLSTLFDEFRVTHSRIEIVPTYNGSATTGMVCVAYDNDSSAAPASIDDVLSFQNSKLESMHKGISHSAKRPNVTSSAYWTDVASPSSSVGGFQFVVGFTTASVTIGYYMLRIGIELRGRR